jgi:hypothetical protein
MTCLHPRVPVSVLASRNEKGVSFSAIVLAHRHFFVVVTVLWACRCLRWGAPFCQGCVVVFARS